MSAVIIADSTVGVYKIDYFAHYKTSACDISQAEAFQFLCSAFVDECGTQIF